jgi:hypothetical protein
MQLCAGCTQQRACLGPRSELDGERSSSCCSLSLSPRPLCCLLLQQQLAGLQLCALCSAWLPCGQQLQRSAELQLLCSEHRPQCSSAAVWQLASGPEPSCSSACALLWGLQCGACRCAEQLCLGSAGRPADSSWPQLWRCSAGRPAGRLCSAAQQRSQQPVQRLPLLCSGLWLCGRPAQQHSAGAAGSSGLRCGGALWPGLGQRCPLSSCCSHARQRTQLCGQHCGCRRCCSSRWQLWQQQCLWQRGQQLSGHCGGQHWHSLHSAQPGIWALLWSWSRQQQWQWQQQRSAGLCSHSPDSEPGSCPEQLSGRQLCSHSGQCLQCSLCAGLPQLSEQQLLSAHSHSSHSGRRSCSAAGLWL